MHKYRKKPVVISAIQNNGDWRLIMDWLDSLENGGMNIPFGFRPAITRNEEGSLNIETKEGVMRADIGDYVICGVTGELYPCKPDIFALTYDLVEET